MTTLAPFPNMCQIYQHKQGGIKNSLEREKKKKKNPKHQPLWFLSGLIYSPLVPFWVLSALFPCEFSSTFTSLPCLWLCIEPSTRWAFLSAFPCIPHWFGLVCELRHLKLSQANLNLSFCHMFQTYLLPPSGDARCAKIANILREGPP